LLPESLPEEMRSTSTTLLPGLSLDESALTSMRVDHFFLRVEEKNLASPWRASLESALTSMRVDRFFLRVEEKTLPLHGGRRWSPQLGPCARVRLPPPGRRRTDLFHGAPRKTHGGGVLGRLLFVTAKPHSLGGGGRQH
jgi:hypothetical protein